MRKVLAAIVLLLSLLPVAFADGGMRNCLPVGDLREETLAFRDGEKLDFSVHYKWGAINADVARAQLSLEKTTMNGQSVFHAAISGRVLKFYEMFFKVRESLDSWFSTDTFVPLRFNRDSREGNYTLTNRSSFAWHGGVGVVTANMKTSRKGHFSFQKEIGACTLDIPTMFFLLRNVDMSRIEKDKSYPLSFIMDSDVYTLHFRYLGDEEKNIPEVGKVSCMKFGFEVVAGDVFSGDSDLYCWLSDDGNRIPVYFSAPLKIGEVRGRLIEYSGLKHPFKALRK